jgi:NAD-dependent dihydropyrimidine dehydrogenase PreA subunit
MIELVSETRCVACDVCVNVCPTNVFDAVPGGVPVIARQSDCQTCFMCELYCPTDALFVSPEADVRSKVEESDLESKGALGSYRAAIGWGRGRASTAKDDQSYRVLSAALSPSNLPVSPKPAAPNT